LRGGRGWEGKLSGFLNTLKPPGMTSHDMVEFVRKLSGQRRVGHTGTLDPAAAGVLPLCLGPSTKLAEYVMEGEKEYRAEVILGIETDSGDLEGEVVAEREVTEGVLGRLPEVLREFVGEIEQEPPPKSAIKVGGRRLYELARSGEEVPIRKRRVVVHEIKLLSARVEGGKARVMLDIRCGKGMYVRALARDIGRRLGVGGCQAFLVRRRVGPFRLEEALTIEEMKQAARDGGLDKLLLPPDVAVQHLPRALLSEQAVYMVIHGNDVNLRLLEAEGVLSVGERVRLYSRDETLVAIGLIKRRVGGLVCHPEKVLVGVWEGLEIGQGSNGRSL